MKAHGSVLSKEELTFVLLPVPMHGILRDPGSGVNGKPGREERWAKMKRMHGGCWLLAGLSLIASGCGRGDTERLARMGRKMVERAEAMSEDTGDRLHSGWQSFRANLDQSGLDARVSTRLRWDKGLADTPIQVEAQGAVVTLKGPVGDLDQRRRAVAIAESTLGVDQVIDALEMPKPE
jgi:osmotically-inducible protein OsmY